ncbi:hypothetical protein BDN71DRAFT_1452943 [Pleurotus eryngii]|uniref:Uncharacterized protein n=1 Tax=Pleurotus eryngii TaxID=5323 RepID=A0A9P6D503_PLEER|nr:hypothetical protein BDN71DRAFT_1452943 [Pleurotus eryngii]
MKIEWTSAQYHPNGTPRRRPLASTMHGWLTKLRGTLLDDEKTRWKGIQEMKEARAIRRWKKQREAQHRASGHGHRIGRLFSIFGKKKKPVTRRPTTSRSQSRAVVRTKTRQRPNPPRHHPSSRGHMRGGPRGGGRPSASRHNSSRHPRVRQ